MSSAIYVARTRFQTLSSEGSVLYETYGARIYDDFENAYVNQLDSLDELMAMDPDELLDHIRENNSTAAGIIDAAKYCELPLYVDDELHSGGEGEDDDLATYVVGSADSEEADPGALGLDGGVLKTSNSRLNDIAIGQER